MAITRGLLRRACSLALIGSLGASGVLLIAGSRTVDAEAGERFSFKPVERCFMRKINQKRRAHGRRALSWDRQLGEVSRRHARHIARLRVVRHDYDYGEKITNWVRLGQNTGRGNRCDSLFKSFWSSSTHRNNILGRWRFIGVGTKRRDGQIYVQQVFESRKNPGNVY